MEEMKKMKKEQKEKIKDIKSEIKVLLEKYDSIAPQHEKATIKKVRILLPLVNNYNSLFQVRAKFKKLLKIYG